MINKVTLLITPIFFLTSFLFPSDLKAITAEDRLIEVEKQLQAIAEQISKYEGERTDLEKEIIANDRDLAQVNSELAEVQSRLALVERDLDRALENESSTAQDKRDSSITATFQEGKGFIPIPDAVVSVVQVFPFDDSSTNNLFDLRYQIRLNDLYDFSSTSIIHYEMTQRHLDYLSHILPGEVPLRFNQHQNRLYLDMDWSQDVNVDDFIIIECYRKLDPDSYTDVYNDMYLKRYATALIKRQWGANLSKFSGVAMLGGVTMNGETIYTQAQEELEKLEEQIQLSFETPIDYMVG